MINQATIIDQEATSIVSKINFNTLNGKTILITGASGLLGVYFLSCVKALNQSGFKITLIAVFRSEMPDYFSIDDFPNLKIYKGDITDFNFCQSLPMADFVIHAAGYGQPLKFMEEPEKTLKLNTFSTFLLFDKLKDNGHFLFVSSSEVYSGLHKQQYTEDDIGVTNTTHPRACYIEGKRAGEAICNAYRTKGVNASSVRLAHTYGPGTKKGDKRVILSFIEKALKGKIELIDDGKALRTYCYIADAIEIMWNVLLHGREAIYNLGGFSQTSIAELGRAIGNILNVPVLIPENENGVSGAPEDVSLDMNKVKNEFGKTDYISLSDGLKSTVSWYLDVNKNDKI